MHFGRMSDEGCGILRGYHEQQNVQCRNKTHANGQGRKSQFEPRPGRGFHYLWLAMEINNPIEIQLFSLERFRELSPLVTYLKQ